MKKVAVAGAAGFVGSHVTEALRQEGLTVVPIYRGDDADEKLRGIDALIHTANSPRRSLAAQDPVKDFQESVEKTFFFSQLAKKHQCRFLLVSSISARTQLHHPYGDHRRACEYIALSNESQVVRLGYMYSYSKIYGALQEIFEDRAVNLDGRSTYSYSDVTWNAKKIVSILRDGVPGITELGSKGSIRLEEIARLVNSASAFVGDYVDVQISEGDFMDQPPISDFIDYLKQVR